MASRSLEDLEPETRSRVMSWIGGCASLDVELLVYCTLRSSDEQARLYAQGRTTPGPIVTKAEPWQSWHQYGRAVDAVPLRAGKPLWKYDRTAFEWQTFALKAAESGLEWAGNWKRFQEYVHVQYVPDGLTTAAAYRVLHPTDGTA